MKDNYLCYLKYFMDESNESYMEITFIDFTIKVIF